MGMPVEESRHEECRAETSKAIATNTDRRVALKSTGKEECAHATRRPHVDGRSSSHLTSSGLSPHTTTATPTPSTSPRTPPVSNRGARTKLPSTPDKVTLSDLKSVKPDGSTTSSPTCRRSSCTILLHGNQLPSIGKRCTMKSWGQRKSPGKGGKGQVRQRSAATQIPAWLNSASAVQKAYNSAPARTVNAILRRPNACPSFTATQVANHYFNLRPAVTSLAPEVVDILPPPATDHSMLVAELSESEVWEKMQKAPNSAPAADKINIRLLRAADHGRGQGLTRQLAAYCIGARLTTGYQCSRHQQSDELGEEKLVDFLVSSNALEPTLPHAGQHITALAFADDIALFAPSIGVMQQQLCKIQGMSSAMGFRFNPKKCASLYLKRAVVNAATFTISGEEIPVLVHGDSYRYLGVAAGLEDGLVLDICAATFDVPADNSEIPQHRTIGRRLLTSSEPPDHAVVWACYHSLNYMLPKDYTGTQDALVSLSGCLDPGSRQPRTVASAYFAKRSKVVEAADLSKLLLRPAPNPACTIAANNKAGNDARGR
ncbi:hypothetical protein T4A_13514 [Trichinella pseudospiralis]|uniref:Reverse transcriptase domain-containing protein n=1 Tax=Trichinella pseudospiralis TaxID=6337 RepID=A0A0V1DSL3_TRIPS|nr:hypothetical protein T4A_13514 [Trichinella pseudospiralis]